MTVYHESELTEAMREALRRGTAEWQTIDEAGVYARTARALAARGLADFRDSRGTSEPGGFRVASYRLTPIGTELRERVIA